MQPFEFVLLESLLDELADFYEASLSRTEDLIADNLDKLTSGRTDEVCARASYVRWCACVYIFGLVSRLSRRFDRQRLKNDSRIGHKILSLFDL